MHESVAIPQRAQGLLFGDELPDLDTATGYRGPTACGAAGITYRQLDCWARTGLVEPSIRPASGSGTQRLELEIPPGRYHAEWVEPVTGRVLGEEMVQHAGGRLALTTPRYAVDIALRILAHR